MINPELIVAVILKISYITNFVIITFKPNLTIQYFEFESYHTNPTSDPVIALISNFPF